MAVTGTRGKSGVARLVAAGLRESGLRTVAKTTGSKPVLIMPDGSEREVPRPGSPSIREQVRLVLAAAAAGADVLVCETMSIGPECLAAESRRILRPGWVALTNVRLDHLDDMGRSKADVASALAGAFPEGGDVFFPAEEAYPAFEEAAARSGCRLHAVAATPDEAGGREEEISLFPFEEFEPNVRLALAVLGALGVDRRTALRGMSGARPDLGSLKTWRGTFGEPPRPAVCVSAFAANEPESSAAALAKVRQKVPAAGRTLLAILSLREDRGDRTLQWIRAIREGFFREFGRVVLAGPTARAALRLVRKAPGPGATTFTCFEAGSPEALMDHLLYGVTGEPVVVGFGNIIGLGERLIGHWDRKGSPHDR